MCYLMAVKHEGLFEDVSCVLFDVCKAEEFLWGFELCAV